MQQVPVISLRRHLDGSLHAEEYRALARACEDHGFFLLSDHGADALVASVFGASADFFAQPKTVKRSVMRDEKNPLGYYDRELTKQRRDQKEVFDFKAGGHMSSRPERQTRWPDDVDFREVLTEFFGHFTALSEQTLAMVLTALGLPQSFIDEVREQHFADKHTSAARLNFYPAADPLSAAERDGVTDLGDMALHHHTDPGAITLLLQDDHGGLQARSATDGWIDVPPVPGTIVVNIGDVLQVWTNDRCTAGMHRVLPVRSERGRNSTPFFYQPSVDALISPWVGPNEQPRYSSFSWRDFIRGRVTDNFADYGEDDIQIERYRLVAGA